MSFSLHLHLDIKSCESGFASSERLLCRKQPPYSLFIAIIRYRYHYIISYLCISHPPTRPLPLLDYKNIMKISFLFLVIPIVAGVDVDTADERGDTPDDNRDVDLIGATDNRPSVLADFDRRTKNRTVGSSYCTYSPDTTCYLSGWPICCSSSNSLAVCQD
jgi:hypothetical protein